MRGAAWFAGSQRRRLVLQLLRAAAVLAVALCVILRDTADRFRGRIATHDPDVSDAGYLFQTQDARQTDAFWRLAEAMGRRDARLLCCLVEMIDDLATRDILDAWNAVRSYAATHARSIPDAAGIELQQFSLVLLRSALIRVTARSLGPHSSISGSAPRASASAAATQAFRPSPRARSSFQCISGPSGSTPASSCRGTD